MCVARTHRHRYSHAENRLGNRKINTVYSLLPVKVDISQIEK